MSENRSIIDRMGIAFLTEPSARSSEPSLETGVTSQQSAINRSSRAFANWTVLSALTELGAHEHPVKMSEVAHATQSRADILLPIEDNLVAQGWIEVVDKTAFGDDSVRLTDDGAAVAQSGEPTAIVKLGEV
jgi:hypothetical protein